MSYELHGHIMQTIATQNLTLQNQFSYSIYPPIIEFMFLLLSTSSASFKMGFTFLTLSGADLTE